MSAAVTETPDINLRVLYDFEYATKDERTVSIAEGERLFLIKKTNPDWWQVIRSSKERPFFVPAKYVEISDAADAHQTREQNGNSTKDDPRCDVDSPTLRILCDKRKSWAVEELLSELTQGRNAPVPEPEPDYETENLLDEDGNVIKASDNLPSSLSKHDRVLSRDNIDLPSYPVGHSITDNTPDSNKLTETGNDLFSGGTVEVPSKEYRTSVVPLDGVGTVEVFKVPQVPNKEFGTSVVPLDGVGTVVEVFKVPHSKEFGTSVAPLDSVGTVEVFKVPHSKEFGTSVVSIDGVGTALAKADSVRSDSGSTKSSRREIYSKVVLVKRDSLTSETGSYARVSVEPRESALVKRDSITSETGSYARVSVEPRESALVKRDSVTSETGSVNSGGSYVKGWDVGSSADDLTRSQRVRKGPKVTQLSESLERLAQQIQFGPAVTSEKPPRPKQPSRNLHNHKGEVLSRSLEHDKGELSRSCDELDTAPSDEDIFTEDKLKTYPNKMFLRVKNKIQHSSSFKTKKEMEKSLRKKYLQEGESFDIRASVSGTITTGADLEHVPFSVPQRENINLALGDGETVSKVTQKEDKVLPEKDKALNAAQKDETVVNVFRKKDNILNAAQKEDSAGHVLPKHRHTFFHFSQKHKEKGVNITQKPKEKDVNITQKPKEKDVNITHKQKDKDVNVTSKDDKVLNVPQKEKGNSFRTDKDEESFQEVQEGLRSLSEVRERRGWRDNLLETPAIIPGEPPFPREDPDTIGEANILRDRPDVNSNLTKIAIGFQNPSYRPISHSLDNFHDPAMLAMHDKLCTALGERNTEKHALSERSSASSEKHALGERNSASSEKASLWGRVRLMSHDGGEKKTRNFHKLKTAIEMGEDDRKAQERGEDRMKQERGADDRMKQERGADDRMKQERGADDRKAQESLDELVFGGKKPEDRSRSGSNTSDDAMLAGEGSRRKTSLSRNNRVESIRERHQLKLPLLRPPSPSPEDLPSRTLADSWAQYRTQDGRTYYYCSATGDKSWKPPRKHGLHSECEDGNSSPTLGINVPSGWREGLDEESGLPVFTHESGAKWFSSSDIEGRLYFFEENSPNSSWTLPSIPGSESSSPTTTDTSTTATGAATTATDTATGTKATTATTILISPPVVCGPPKSPPAVKPSIANIVQSLMEERRKDEETVMRAQLDGKPNRLLKTRSMVLVPPTYDDKSPTFMPPNWPHLFEGNMKIVREGPMHRTKITEHGKKVRKNWSQSYVLLTELLLLFYSDIKHAVAMKNGSGTGPPELCIDLSGANIERADKLSSRKNVFVVSTQLGHQVLIQCDSSKTAELWYHSIHTVIALLPRNENSPILLKSSPDVVKKPSRLGYSRSMRVKKEGSVEDLTVNPNEQSKIRARLKKFFVRRPTKESLVKKGIYKDEPMFGRNLSDVILPHSTVPQFVIHCIDVIESKEENMKADGLYRVSGNLSQVQKIRLQADQNNLLAIDQEEDVHVLTGALKLFFRELKNPLIPCEHFAKALKASSNPNKKEKLQQFREIVKALPPANRNTLQYLLQHLLRVAKYKEFNRMHIPNVAIVFGPSLMWPEEEELGNMAIDLMQQNLVVECLLVDFDQIFR